MSIPRHRQQNALRLLLKREHSRGLLLDHLVEMFDRVGTAFRLGGAGGFRVGEELGIEIDKHMSRDCLTITIEQKARRGRVENRVKTRSAKRQVDLDPAVAKLLKGFIGTRTSGFLFQTRNGTPLSLTNVLRRHLHPALKKLGYVNPHTGDHKAGTHAFRRFRNTYLKNETSCPKGLRDHWLGPAGNSMDDQYDMVKQRRLSEAEGCGVRDRPRIAEFGLNCTECNEKLSQNENEESCVNN